MELEDGFCGSIMEGRSDAAIASEHATGFDDSNDKNAFTQTEWK